MSGPWTPEYTRQRRAETARLLLRYHQNGEAKTGWEYDQAHHWLYCLDAVLGTDRRDGEEYWTWVERLTK